MVNCSVFLKLINQSLLYGLKNCNCDYFVQEKYGFVGMLYFDVYFDIFEIMFGE